MNRGWMLIGAVALTAMLALGAVACSDDNNDGGGATATQAENTAVEGVTPGASGEPVDVTINEVGGSGVSGTATLIEGDQGLEVEISVSGLTEGTHPNHIHQGATCTSPTSPPTAPIVEALPDLVADASGEVQATTTITTSSLSDFQDGNSYVAVHASSGEVIGCGDIPAAS